MQKYCEQINTASPTRTAVPMAQSDPIEPSVEQLMDTYGLDDEDGAVWSDAAGDTQSIEQEFQAYIMEPQSNHTDRLHALLEGESLSTISIHLIMSVIPQLCKESFPTLYAMAINYLPIQASSVSCKRAFLSSSEMDMKKCNRINDLLMEALQMLKFVLKWDHLSVNKCFPNTVKKDMDYDDLTLVCTSDALPTDILTKLMDVIGGSEMQNVLDRVIAATKPVAAVDALPTEEEA